MTFKKKNKKFLSLIKRDLKGIKEIALMRCGTIESAHSTGLAVAMRIAACRVLAGNVDDIIAEAVANGAPSECAESIRSTLIMQVMLERIGGLVVQQWMTEQAAEWASYRDDEGASLLEELEAHIELCISHQGVGMVGREEK